MVLTRIPNIRNRYAMRTFKVVGLPWWYSLSDVDQRYFASEPTLLNLRRMVHEGMGILRFRVHIEIAVQMAGELTHFGMMMIITCTSHIGAHNASIMLEIRAELENVRKKE
ncbi:hypothetical protein JTB14_028727 [Gonioctena quinquepunctata]|nr:hypothetical protein JTB14_028727 [Gonioctena quinquepunctata]